MRMDVMKHELAAADAETAAEVAVAALTRMGQLGRPAGEAFGAKYEAAKAEGGAAFDELEEGLGWLQP